MSNTLGVHLTFLEPYRMVKWLDRSDRINDARAMRGQTFVRWKDEGAGGLPIITGSIVRSATIKAAEEILSLNKGVWKGVNCCNGTFQTEDGKKPVFLRKRHTLQWENKTRCTRDSMCPYCILLGTFDNAGKDHKNSSFKNDDYAVHFSNFYLCEKYKKNGMRIEDFAFERVLNRVDFHTGKAKDYFRTWEADFEAMPEYTGRITLNHLCENAMPLLLNSIGFIDKICGALCKIEVIQKTEPHSSSNETPASLSVNCKITTESPEKQKDGLLKSRAGEIAKALAFKDVDCLKKARVLADAIRSLRLQKPDIIESDGLPKGKKDGDKGHHLWDIEVDKKPVRTILKELWERFASDITSEKIEGTEVEELKKKAWRRFTETLGNYLYLCYKEETGGISLHYRPLGETEYSKTHDAERGKGAGLFIPVTPQGSAREIKEWIVTGNLRSVTPFYFGVQPSADLAKDGKGQEGLETVEHTSARILLDKNNRYRIPRSVIRGALRRDLRIAFGSGCDVELGGEIPCGCNVCAIMRKITVKDSASNLSEPPEIRYRIERNPYTATVEEGSLFDLEVGPEGIAFPFVLRYRGAKFPKELAIVIRYWQNDEMAWLGGFGSIGKGRFALVGVKAFEWILKDSGLDSYILEKGLRESKNDLLEGKDSYPEGLTEFTLFEKLSNHESYHDNLKPLCTEVSYTIEIGSPLLTADTIAALTASGNKDAIAYRKRVYVDGRNEPDIKFAVKAETHRGIFRTAFGRRTNGKGPVKDNAPVENDLAKDSHEDCTCNICKVFGNEHESSKIRFEDLVVSNGNEFEPLEIHIDHVAIDRFNGGAVDKKKFDASPLAGSPNKPLRLKGSLWIKKSLLGKHEELQLLAAAFSDIQDGLYPLGGRSGAGYGWVTGMEIANAPDELKDKIRPKELPAAGEAPSGIDLFPPVDKPKLKPDGCYFPYIFLHPHSAVKREKEVIGHEQFDGNLKSGKIICTLETLTPLIIPNTDPKKVVTDENGHKSYEFFSINGETLIPGSEIRGMVSSIYEALTNSCFRIFEEGRYISRRITPPKNKDKEEEEEENRKPQTKCGIVKEENGVFKIITTWETIKGKGKGKEKEKEKDTELYFYRLPLYDDAGITNAIPFDESKEGDKTRRRKIDDAMKWNKEIAAVAKGNQDYLKGLPDEDRKAVLNGRKEIKFSVKENKRNPNDHLACLVGNEAKGYDVKAGYIKFTGLNTVQIDKDAALEFEKEEYDRFLKSYFEKAQITVKEKGNTVSVDLCNIGEEKLKELETVFNDIVTGDIYLLNSRHNTYQWRSSLKKEYPRPHLWFIKDSVQYNIPKRCERVFLASSNKNTAPKEYKISDNVRKQYNAILEDYKKNFDHVEEKFRTITQNEKLSDGDLVYFISNEDNKIATNEDDKTVLAVFPVPLSRKADDKALGERLPHHSSLFPCVKEKAVDIPAEAAKYLDSKVLQLHDEGMCPACRLFGTGFYKGRVRFGFAKLTGEAKWHRNDATAESGHLTLPLLERPRPTWSLPKEDSKIPGRKLYHHHHGWKDVKGEKKTKNNCSVKALGMGSKFSFEVYFENLSECELGLLLYSLELEQQLAHKLGKAKAFGFGSVRITVENVLEIDTGGKWASSHDKKHGWREAGLKKLKEWFCTEGQKWHDITHIKNLRTILRFLQENEQLGKYLYPKLKREDEKDTKSPPGYIELKEKLNACSQETREKVFTDPGFSWHPFTVDVTNYTENSQRRIQKETVKEKDKKVYRKERMTAKKHTGVIKSIDYKGEIIIIVKDNGRDTIRGKISDAYNPDKLESGKKIRYTIVEGNIPLAQNIEILE